MGSKGSNAKQTSNTNQTQQYQADPRIKDSAYQALDMASGAASQPFQMPVAPVAGFNPFQQQSFEGVQNIQGMWQPYVDAARSYYGQSAAPVTGEDVAQYYNPMAKSVFDNLAETQGKQWNETTRGLTGAAGGVGASRIAVGQAELARQQSLAAGQVGAGLYQQALGAAQQQKQMAANAGAGMLNVGAGGQRMGTQDIALMGQAGLQQQQQQQAELNAPYQNRLAQIAYPFQTAQYLAGITGGLSGSLGGTTTGQSQTTSEYQPARPSGLAQGIGLGMQGLGMLMGMPTIPGMGMTGFGGFGGGGQLGSVNQGWGNVPTYFAEGGAVDEPSPSPMGSKGIVPQISLPMSQGHSGPLVGGIAFATPPKMPTEGQSAPSNAQAASKAMGQLGGLVKDQDSYEPDTDMASGGSVFPKHFYDGGDVGGGSGWGDEPAPTPLLEKVFGPRDAWEKPAPLPEAKAYPDAYDDWTKGNEPAAIPAAPAAAPAPNAPVNTLPQTLNVLPKPRDLAVLGRLEGGKGGYDTVVDTQKGDDALGMYGIREGNLREWGMRHLGRPVTRQEFMSNPNIQDAIAGGEFGRLRAQYGPEGAASRWLTGENGNPYATDRFGTSGISHGQNFMRTAADLGASRGAGTFEPEIGAARTVYPRAGGSGPTEGYYALPRGRMPYPDSLNRDWGQQMARSPWMSLVKAGAVTASTPGPVGAALARGIGAGADHLTSERNSLRNEELINQRAQGLHQTAQHYFDQQNKMTPYQQEMLKTKDDALAKTIYPGKGKDENGDMVDGYYQYNPATNKYDFNPGAVITGRGGAGGRPTALQSNVEWMIKNKIDGVENETQAFAKLREAARNPNAKSNMIRQWTDSIIKNDPSFIGRREAAEALARQKVEEYSQYGSVPPGAAKAAAPKPSLTSEQEGALKFIQENPNDPRTPAIKKKLKEQGIE